MTGYTVVVPTIGRPSLNGLLTALDGHDGAPREIVVVHDRDGAGPELPRLSVPVRLLCSYGRGPAAARNVGWRHADTPWIVFLDDDVTPAPTWHEDLAADLKAAEPADAASQARLEVRLPRHREPTDAERNTAALTEARWITADIAYRRAVLEEVDGFDERFPRAYREDADLGLRVSQAGYRITRGRRVSVHALPHSAMFASVRAQAGNADDALMRHKHGPDWRQLIGESRSSLGRYAFITAAGLGAALSYLSGRKPTALALAALWSGLTAEFTARRVAPGPRTDAEITRMAVSSALIPPVACWHRLAGTLRHRHRGARPLDAVLFDRDGTLIEDVPYLRDPADVRLRPKAAEALRRLRRAGVPAGVVTNQPGVSRRVLTPHDLDTVHSEVDDKLGAFDTWEYCPHTPEEECSCRKPAAGLVERAAAELGVDPARCVVIGDTAADMGAAEAAGARGILVPNDRTDPAEVERARRLGVLAPDLDRAVRMALAGAS